MPDLSLRHLHSVMQVSLRIDVMSPDHVTRRVVYFVYALSCAVRTDHRQDDRTPAAFHEEIIPIPSMVCQAFAVPVFWVPRLLFDDSLLLSLLFRNQL